MTLEERLQRFLGKQPVLGRDCYVAPSAVLIGDVRLGDQASVWPQCALRADINFIEIGAGTNIQDGTVIHLADEHPVRVGRHVTVGHRAVLHACAVEDECLIGMGAVILDGAVVGANSIIGANSLVTQGTVIPPGSLTLGTPARVIRTLSPEEQAGLRRWAEKYITVAAAHRSNGT